MAGSQKSWDLSLNVFACPNLHASPFANMDNWLTLHDVSLVCQCEYVTVKYWYIHIKEQKHYLWVSGRTSIFTSGSNDSPLKLSTTQVQSVPRPIDCTGDLGETVKDFKLVLVWVEDHFRITSPVMPITAFVCVGLISRHLMFYHIWKWTLIKHLKFLGCLDENCKQGYPIWSDRGDLISFSVNRSTFSDWKQNTTLNIRGAIFQNLFLKLVFIGFSQLKSY